jgi:hypothetical protein
MFLSNNFKVLINIGELKKVRHILLFFLAKIKHLLFFLHKIFKACTKYLRLQCRHGCALKLNIKSIKSSLGYSAKKIKVAALGLAHPQTMHPSIYLSLILQFASVYQR